MLLIEPCLEIPLDDLDQCIAILKNLNFTSAIFEVRDNDIIALNSIKSAKKNMDKNNEFPLFYRKTLPDLGNKEKNKRVIELWRNKVHLLVQECTNPDVTKWASQDQRIDVLKFDFFAIHELLDLSTARIMSENDKFLEINLNRLLKKKTNIIKISRNLLKALKRVSIKEVPILFSTYSSSPYDLMGKFELKGVLSFLAIKHEFYFDFSQLKLSSRLERNKNRLNANFIAPGIKKLSK